MPDSAAEASPAGSEDVERFLRYLSLERGRAENTVRAYRQDLELYRDWLASQGIEELQRVDSSEIERFSHGLEGSPRTIQRRLSAVRSLHRYLHEVEGQPSNPAEGLSGPRQAERLPKALGVAEVTRLLESVNQDDPVSVRDRALLELLYASGARVSEVSQLAVDDVHSSGEDDIEFIRVIGKGNKERLVPLGTHARAALDAYLVRSRPVFARRQRTSTPALFLGVRGARLSRQSIWLVLKSRAHAAGITESLSPHTLRHSCATHLVHGGADIRVVQELLGHQSVQTTQIYTRVTIDSLRDVYYTAHPRARG